MEPSLLAIKGYTHGIHIVSSANTVYVPGPHAKHSCIAETCSEKNPSLLAHSVEFFGVENGKKSLQSMQTVTPSVLIFQICSELHETHVDCPDSAIKPVKAKLHSAMCIFIQLCRKTPSSHNRVILLATCISYICCMCRHVVHNSYPEWCENCYCFVLTCEYSEAP